MIKFIKDLFKKKPKIHICQFETYMTTGQGGISDTKAYLQKCECGKRQVIHKGGTFPLDD